MNYEKEYARAVNSKGKYTYVSGYKEKKVKVIHNKCGNVIELSIPGALVETKKDTCKMCKPFKPNKYYQRRTKKNMTEIEKYVNKEAKKLMEVMHFDGYLFGLDLKEYVRLAVISDNFALTKFKEKDLIDTYISLIKEKYDIQRIAICRDCNTILKGSKWGSKDNYTKRRCIKCEKKGEKKDE